ncbi:MAG: gamma carbonic anhydrase family protein [Euryarchaeota archaeon]|jgi:carbonic anhydrase/acetyltransferase-like protein (isoleucine patch superfamily)|nr:gamma carbonic anhydrase family protein [Euryarchaeota archaeon]
MPKIHESSYIASNAMIIGNVTIGKNCGVYPHAVIRGDENAIVIGDGSNIQDCCVLHTDADHQVNIGKNVTVGHAAVIHGATIADDCLIGIQATVLNGAQIQSGSIIGACALVTENMVVPQHSLVLGVPGKVIKQDPQFIDVIRNNAETYRNLAKKHKQGIYPVHLPKDEASR